MTNKINIPLRVWGKQFEFIPGRKTLLLILTLFPLLVYLGFWQLHRAKLKESWLMEYEQQQQQNVASFNQWLSNHTTTDIQAFNNQYPFHKFSLKGAYDPRYFLLDNQILEGRPGFRVLQLFKLDNVSDYVFIDRGWIGQNKQRTDLPKVPTPTEVVELQVMAYVVASGIVLKDVELDPGWPKLIQEVDLDRMTGLGPKTSHPLVLQLEANQTGILKHVPPKLPIPPEKHLGYAFQWFTMALALLIYLFLINLRRIHKDEQPNC